MSSEEECSCVETSAIKADVTKLELGPAYNDYKNGKHIPFEWKPDIDLVKDGWINRCCATGDVDFTLGKDSELHYALLGIWCVLSLLLFAFFFRHREEQPFKFRDWRVVSLMYLNMAFMMFCYTFNYTMDATASTTSNLFVTFVGLPTQVGYYILKSFQLLYIYKWNEMKNKHKDLQTLQLFKKYQFVLTTKFFVIGFFTFAAVGCALAIAQTQYPVYRDALSDHFLSTTRCYFWQFDEHYQQNTTTKIPMCDCFFSTVYRLPEFTAPCEAAQTDLGLKCFGVIPGNEAEMELCTACLLGTEQECLDWFTEYFITGACGQLPQVPKTSTCTYAIPANRLTMYTAGGYISFLLLVNLLLILPISYKIDQFGMIFENTLVFAGLGTCLGIYNAGLLILDFYESWDDLSPDYSLTFLLIWVENWWCMVTTLGCAIIHYLWGKYRRQRRHFVQKRRKSLENGAAVMMKIFKREDNWSAMSAVDELDAEIEFWLKHKPVREYYKQFALEEFTAENPAFLEECYEYLLEVWEALKHPTLSLMLSLMAQGQKLSDKYVANGSPMEVNLSSRTKKKVQEALDDSNVHFDGSKLNVLDGENTPTYQPVTSEREDSRIYSQNSNHESQGPESEMEDIEPTESISEPGGAPGTPRGSTPKAKRESESRKKSSRKRIFSRRSEKSSTSSNLSEEDNRAQMKIKQLEDAFLQALNDIRDLVTRDSWPRFRDSRHYVQFQMLYENENRLNAQVETVTSAKQLETGRPTNDAGEPRESFFQRVRSFSNRRSLSESRPSSFVVVNHTPQLGSDPNNSSPATDNSRKGSAGEAIAAKFIGSGSGSFRMARVTSVQEEGPASLDIGDSSL